MCFAYGKGQILMRHAGDHTGSKYFYLHDRLGSIRQVIDSSADVVNCYTYDPWGLAIGSETSETFFNPYRFAGYFFEPEVSQYHCFRRQYDPVTFRFTSRDPVNGKFKEPMTLHKYLYCLNDPVNKVDPSGDLALLIQLPMTTAIQADITARQLTGAGLAMAFTYQLMVANQFRNAFVDFMTHLTYEGPTRELPWGESLERMIHEHERGMQGARQFRNQKDPNNRWKRILLGILEFINSLTS